MQWTSLRSTICARRQEYLWIRTTHKEEMVPGLCTAQGLKKPQKTCCVAELRRPVKFLQTGVYSMCSCVHVRLKEFPLLQREGLSWELWGNQSLVLRFPWTSVVFSASHFISLCLSFFICKINPSNTIGSASYSKLHLMLNHVFYLSICLLIFIVSSSGQKLSLEVSYIIKVSLAPQIPFSGTGSLV